MSFDTPSGTKGARQPSAGRLMRWFNKLAMNRIRKSGKFMGGMKALVLTTVGRKSGAQRSTPVGYFPGQDGSWLIVASAAGPRGILRGTTTSLRIPTRFRST